MDIIGAVRITASNPKSQDEAAHGLIVPSQPAAAQLALALNGVVYIWVQGNWNHSQYFDELWKALPTDKRSETFTVKGYVVVPTLFPEEVPERIDHKNFVVIDYTAIKVQAGSGLNRTPPVGYRVLGSITGPGNFEPNYYGDFEVPDSGDDLSDVLESVLK